MNILIDECLPKYLGSALPGHDVRTVQEAGWAGTKNGPLLTLAEVTYDVFLTADQNLRYQQNLENRRIAIVVLPSNRLSIVKEYEANIVEALAEISPGDYIQL